MDLDKVDLLSTSPALSKYTLNLVNSIGMQFLAYQRCLPCHGLFSV